MSTYYLLSHSLHVDNLLSQKQQCVGMSSVSSAELVTLLSESDSSGSSSGVNKQKDGPSKFWARTGSSSVSNVNGLPGRSETFRLTGHDNVGQHLFHPCHDPVVDDGEQIRHASPPRAPDEYLQSFSVGQVEVQDLWFELVHELVELSGILLLQAVGSDLFCQLWIAVCDDMLLLQAILVVPCAPDFPLGRAWGLPSAQVLYLLEVAACVCHVEGFKGEEAYQFRGQGADGSFGGLLIVVVGPVVKETVPPEHLSDSGAGIAQVSPIGMGLPKRLEGRTTQAWGVAPTHTPVSNRGLC